MVTAAPGAAPSGAGGARQRRAGARAPRRACARPWRRSSCRCWCRRGRGRTMTAAATCWPTRRWCACTATRRSARSCATRTRRRLRSAASRRRGPRLTASPAQAAGAGRARRARCCAHMLRLRHAVVAPGARARAGGARSCVRRSAAVSVSPSSYRRAAARPLSRRGARAQVYAALDVLGQVPWRINGPVHAAVEAAWAAGGGVCDLPSAADLPPVPPPRAVRFWPAPKRGGQLLLTVRARPARPRGVACLPGVLAPMECPGSAKLAWRARRVADGDAHVAGPPGDRGRDGHGGLLPPPGQRAHQEGEPRDALAALRRQPEAGRAPPARPPAARARSLRTGGPAGTAFASGYA